MTIIYEEHNQTYGYRRIMDEYNETHDTKYNKKRFHRLAKIAGLQAIIRRKKPAYHYHKEEQTAENILARTFTAEQPNEKWLTDVTEMTYGNGQKLYLSAIMDLGAKDIVAYTIGESNNNHLVFSNLDLAIEKYPKAQPLIHSDRGFQYTSKSFKAKLDAAGMTQSMSRKGKCIDNGPMEGFWGILKTEMYYLNTFGDKESLENAIAEFIDYYNNKRRQRRLDRLPPMEYRKRLEMSH
jgi:putative transposase